MQVVDPSKQAQIDQAKQALDEAISAFKASKDQKLAPEVAQVVACLERIKRNGRKVSPKQWHELIAAMKAAEVSSFSDFNFWGTLHSPLVSAVEVLAAYVNEFGYGSMSADERQAIYESSQSLIAMLGRDPTPKDRL